MSKSIMVYSSQPDRGAPQSQRSKKKQFLFHFKLKYDHEYIYRRAIMAGHNAELKTTF